MPEGVCDDKITLFRDYRMLYAEVDNMKVGIIGTVGSGKTTLFNALTGMSVRTGAGGRKTNLAVVKVPDERLDNVAQAVESEKVVHAEISFSDVAGGLGKPTREKGIEPKLLNLMSAEEAFAMVVADFEGYGGADESEADPMAQARELESDLALADLVVIDNKLERMAKENATGIERDALDKCRAHLEEEQPLRTLELNQGEAKALSSYGFLSLKKGVLIRNIGEEKLGEAAPAGIEDFVASRGLRQMSVAAKLEMEIAQMDPEERGEYAQAMGLEGFALENFIKQAFNALDLISFFTIAGPSKEAHAWNIKRGSPAIEAAGRVHTDMQRGFIKAEVVAFEDWRQYGGEAGARQAGKLRLEGKEYVVQDGDIIQFRFNV